MDEYRGAPPCRKYAILNSSSNRSWTMPWTRVALLVLFSSSAFGQDAALNLRVDTTLVQIPVAVTDSLNRFVLGLQKEEFRLPEDGVEQTVVHFSGEDAPLSIGLVFDESGSMDYKLRTTQAAVAQFLKT